MQDGKEDGFRYLPRRTLHGQTFRLLGPWFYVLLGALYLADPVPKGYDHDVFGRADVLRAYMSTGTTVIADEAVDTSPKTKERVVEWYNEHNRPKVRPS